VSSSLQSRHTPIGLYIDFPFCIARCAFCAFHVQGFRSRSAERYLSALKKEMELTASSGVLKDHQVTSIYLGGGTPTQYDPEIISELIALCRKYFSVSADAEISLESHPATLDHTKLLKLRKGGINRLSMGVQSFSDEHLKALGRHHTVEEAKSAFHAARSAGFDNIAIDLIYGLPDQTSADWNNSLQQAIELSPEHLSIYALSIEEGTLFGRLEKEGRLRLPSEDVFLTFYETARTQLVDAGYRHYEISNFAKRGKDCLHNMLYWDRGETMAFGLAGHSYLNQTHQENTDNLEDYIDTLEADKLPLAHVEKIDVGEMKTDQIIFGLRKIEGIPLSFFEDDTRHCATRDQLVQDGLLSIEEGKVQLSRKGQTLADEVAVSFL